MSTQDAGAEVSKNQAPPLSDEAIAAAKAALIAEGWHAPANDISALGATPETVTGVNLDLLTEVIVNRTKDQLQQQGWLPPQAVNADGQPKPRKKKKEWVEPDSHDATKEEVLAELHAQPRETLTIPTPQFIQDLPEYQEGKVDHYVSFQIVPTHWHIPTGIPCSVPRSVYELAIQSGHIQGRTQAEIAMAPALGRRKVNRNKYEGRDPDLVHMVYGSYDRETPRGGLSGEQPPTPEEVKKAVASAVPMEGPPGARRAPQPKAA